MVDAIGAQGRRRNKFVARRLDGLTDRSRRPYRQANQLPFQVESRIVQLKREHPGGAPRPLQPGNDPLPM